MTDNLRFSSTFNGFQETFSWSTIYQLTGYDLLVMYDRGIAPFKDFEGHDLLGVVEERHDRGSLIIASQLPLENWHETLPDPTVADAIMDRIIHNSHRISLAVTFLMEGDR